jgi:IS30 family transposase
MARALKRHKSTIFREIKRNFWADDAFQKSTQATSVMPHNCRQTSVDRYSGS